MMKMTFRPEYAASVFTSMMAEGDKDDREIIQKTSLKICLVPACMGLPFTLRNMTS